MSLMSMPCHPERDETKIFVDILNKGIKKHVLEKEYQK